MKRLFLGVFLLVIGLGLWSYLQRNRTNDQKEPSFGSPEVSLATPQGLSPVPRVESVDSASNANSSTKLAATHDPITEPALAAQREKQVFRIKGLKPKEANVHVAVFENETGFPQTEHSSQTMIVKSSEDEVSFSLELPLNQPVAVAVFQDLDGNGSLSKNSLGIPSEPYGFSNNARGTFGPPAFRQATLTLQHQQPPNGTIEIRIR